MPTLLFEIGCEELPASACREATLQLPELCRRHLGTEPSGLYVGPRRLAVLVAELLERAPDERRRGPAERIAFDDEGRPTKAAEGFARGQGVPVCELERSEGHLWATVRGESIVATLPGRLAAFVRGLSFGKSMRWDDGGLRFSRPVRWLCAKLDAETIPVELAGLTAGGHTYGHRFTSGAVEVPTARAYLETLRAAGVEPDSAERRRRIIEALDATGEWSDPAGVLREVVHLVESPRVQEGSYAERFRELPERVVVTAMQSHQRYFPLPGNRFAFVANGGDPEVVRAGNERVLEGRLDDAAFTYERDLAVGIDGLLARLPAITFVAGAGSYADKTERLVALVSELGGGEEAVQAARLAKADQAAELVREFPELEGHVGALYARLAGQPEAVCAALDEQYLPDAAGGPLPETEAGRLLAAADKIDALRIAFGLGQRPSGSRDPHGLRRAAIGLCRLAWEGGVSVPTAVLGDEVADFVEERYEGLLDVPVE
ncbi:MAG: glycine--tRNA ligase subunit beta, partial [Actinobacteria bacterium]|nr:glycine--tRNA ligase subunit beta [Actinomycetota bacterium]